MANRSRQPALKPIHPFPARMAPDLVLEWLRAIGDNRRVLDPMAGSGVVLRQAIELGHEAVGFDLDPLAVLMARVWTTPVAEGNLDGWATRIVSEARATSESEVQLDWIDGDEETRSFTEYWFATSQRADLRRIAFVLNRNRPGRLRRRQGVARRYPAGTESYHRHQGAACVAGKRYVAQPPAQSSNRFRLSGVHGL